MLLAHPGGPFWAKKDEGAWALSKGEPAEGEELLHESHHEFSGRLALMRMAHFSTWGTITQAGGKKVTAWSFEGNCEPAALKSDVCEIEWPLRSKRTM